MNVGNVVFNFSSSAELDQKEVGTNTDWANLSQSVFATEIVFLLINPPNQKESYDQPRQHIKKQRHYFANKGPSSLGYGFSSGHVWM